MSRVKVNITVSIEHADRGRATGETIPLPPPGLRSQLLGSGSRLFDNLGEAKPRLRQMQAVDAPGVTHIRYRRDANGQPGPTGEGRS